jgi:hypothetical protein
MVKRMYWEQWHTIPACFVIAHLLFVLDGDIAPTDIWPPLTAVSRVRLGDSPCFIFGVESGTEEDFLQVFWVSRASSHSTKVPHSYIIKG